MVGTEALEPNVWRQEWIPKVKLSLVTHKKKKGTLLILDLDTTALLLGWIVLGVVEVNPRHKHVEM